LKGENLLLTSNGRLKITDFGFARIAARNAEESRRLTFCGTDSYMSPEILIGNEFGLPTDVFSLGVIVCELISRKLADDHCFKRAPPYYDLQESELRALASPGAPEDFIKLAMQCCDTNPIARPTMLQILERLKNIELEVLSRDSEAENLHVGSVKLFTGVGTKRGGRQGLGPRIPSFGQDVGSDIRGKKEGEKKKRVPKGPRGPGDSGEDSGETTPEETSEDEELMEAIESLKLIPSRSFSGESSKLTAKGPDTKLPFDTANDSLPLQHKHVKDTHHVESTLSQEPLLHRDSVGSIAYTDYSTSVVRKANGGGPPTLSSVLTVRPAGKRDIDPLSDEPEPISQSGFKTLTTDSRVSVDSYHTADGGTTSSFITNPYASHLINGKELDETEGSARVGGGYSSSTLGGVSIAAATEGGSTVRSEIIGGLHRFTLIKPGATTSLTSTANRSAFPGSPSKPGKQGMSNSVSGYSWSPFNFFFSSFGGGKKDNGSGGSASIGVKGAKCDLCGKRLGWKPCLECDDCGMRSVLSCLQFGC
jgi:LIM domain kinase 1